MAGKLEVFISIKALNPAHAVVHVLRQLLVEKMLTVCGFTIEDCENNRVMQSCSHYHNLLSF